MADGATFEVEVDATEVLARLENAGKKLTDLSDYFQRIGKFMRGFYSTFPFITQGGIYDDPWPELSEDYAVQKAEKYRGRNILVATGQMQDGFRDDPDKTSVRIFNIVDWFQYHQTGTANMPQRIVMQLEERQIKEINDELTKYAEEVMGG